MPEFKEDLEQEKIIAQFLDAIYTKLNLQFERVTDKKLQFQGIDLIYVQNQNTVHIDEKAQLHYLNKDLPTFTFELSYKKNGVLKKGWLFDGAKKTDYYFLVTGIFLKNNTLRHFENIKACKITSIDRRKLLSHLGNLGLSEAKLEFYDHELRKNQEFGKHIIEEIGAKHGSLHFTEHLSEQPINLKLRLDYLLRMKIAKRLFPIN